MNPSTKADVTSDMPINPKATDVVAEVITLLEDTFRAVVLALNNNDYPASKAREFILLMDSLVPTLGQTIDLLETLVDKEG